MLFFCILQPPPFALLKSHLVLDILGFYMTIRQSLFHHSFNSSAIACMLSFPTTIEPTKSKCSWLDNTARCDVRQSTLLEANTEVLLASVSCIDPLPYIPNLYSSWPTVPKMRQSECNSLYIFNIKIAIAKLFWTITML